MSTLVDNVAGRMPRGGQFQGNYRHGCVAYAYMIGRTALDPGRACTDTILSDLITSAINAGLASAPHGAMTPGQLAGLCHADGMPYQQTTGVDWLSVVKANDEKQPIVIMVEQGYWLPGNEAGVYFHAVCILDHDAQTKRLIVANGDSANGRNGKPDVLMEQDMYNARPYSLTILKGELMAIDTTGLGAGFAQEARRLGLVGEHTPEVYEGDWSYAVWPHAGGGTIMTYAPGQGVKVFSGGAAWMANELSKSLGRSRLEVARLVDELKGCEARPQISVAAIREHASAILNQSHAVYGAAQSILALAPKE